MPKDFKDYCVSKSMSVLREMLENGPGNANLEQFQITEQEFYSIVEDTLLSKYRN
jgi:hypothetical protein